MHPSCADTSGWNRLLISQMPLQWRSLHLMLIFHIRDLSTVTTRSGIPRICDVHIRNFHNIATLLCRKCGFMQNPISRSICHVSSPCYYPLMLSHFFIICDFNKDYMVDYHIHQLCIFLIFSYTLCMQCFSILCFLKWILFNFLKFPLNLLEIYIILHNYSRYYILSNLECDHHTCVHASNIHAEVFSLQQWFLIFV